MKTLIRVLLISILFILSFGSIALSTEKPTVITIGYMDIDTPPSLVQKRSFWLRFSQVGR